MQERYSHKAERLFLVFSEKEYLGFFVFRKILFLFYLF